MKTIEPIPEMMRAALLVGTGGPKMLEVRADVPVPQLDQGHVLVRVSACGVNNTDINTRVGWYSRSVTGATSGAGFATPAANDVSWGRQGLTFPRVQGADIAGIVVAVAAGTNEQLLGNRVIADPWLRDRHEPNNRELAGYLGSEHNGGFAEYCALPSENVYPIENSMTDIELASFACSWSTAEHMLTKVELSQGESIAVPGASGGVGSALVQLAKLRGAKVLAIAGTEKLTRVLAMGADKAVPRSTKYLVATAIVENDGLFDVVADIVGGSNFGFWLESLKRGGRYVTSGAIAGPVVNLDLRTLYLRDLQLHGATIYQPQVFADLVTYINQGTVNAVVGGVFPLEQIRLAQKVFEAKKHVGSIVITI